MAAAGGGKGRDDARNVLHCLEARELVRQSERLSRCKVHGCFTGILIYLARVWARDFFFHVAVTPPHPPAFPALSFGIAPANPPPSSPTLYEGFACGRLAGTTRWTFNDRSSEASTSGRRVDSETLVRAIKHAGDPPLPRRERRWLAFERTRLSRARERREWNALAVH